MRSAPLHRDDRPFQQFLLSATPAWRPIRSGYHRPTQSDYGFPRTRRSRTRKNPYCPAEMTTARFYSHQLSENIRYPRRWATAEKRRPCGGDSRHTRESVTGERSPIGAAHEHRTHINLSQVHRAKYLTSSLGIARFVQFSEYSVTKELSIDGCVPAQYSFMLFTATEQDRKFTR